MLVAACLESTSINKNSLIASSNYAAGFHFTFFKVIILNFFYLACFYWFAFSAYLAELILDFNLIGELGFESTQSNSHQAEPSAPSV